MLADVEVEHRLTHHRHHAAATAAHADVVAVQRDIDRPDGRGRTRELCDECAKAIGQRHAACVQPHQRDGGWVGVMLHDLVGDTRDRAPALFGVNQNLGSHGATRLGVRRVRTGTGVRSCDCSFPASQDRR